MNKQQQIQMGIKITIVLILLTTFAAAFVVGMIHQFYKLNPQTEYTINKIGEKFPAEAIYKADLINLANKLIWAGLLLFVCFTVLEYFENPDEHYFKKIMNFFLKLDKDNGDED